MLTLAKIGMALLGVAAPPDLRHTLGGDSRPVASGVVVRVTYRVKDGREVPGSRTVETISFSGAKTRWDIVRSDRPPETVVRADVRWSRSAGWDRVRETAVSEPMTYPEEARETLRRQFAKRTGQKVTLNGRNCWKYSWHEPAVTAGDIAFGGHDITYWVLADARLPLILKSESSDGGRMGTRELRLNVPVGDSVFAISARDRRINSFSMPEGTFEIEVRRERLSHAYGWRIISREVYAGNRHCSTHTYASVRAESNRTESRFEAPLQSFGPGQTSIEIQRLFELAGGIQVGTSMALGLRADILVEQMRPDDKITQWVVDHPQLGTICIKTLRNSDDETETMEIIRLRVGGSKSNPTSATSAP